MISRKLQFIVAVLVVAILAMGFYLVHLKRKAESSPSAPSPRHWSLRSAAPPADDPLFRQR